MVPFLEAKKISKAFDGVQALDDVNISIDEGAVHCLVGENGSGKSTLIKIIAGILKPDTGQMRINGRLFSPARAIESIRQGIQIIYQDLALFSNLTVAENISMNQLIEKGNKLVSRKKLIETAQKALAEIEEECDLFEKVENLSMSKRQVVAISRALTQNARLIIMDEPTSAITKAEVEHLFSVITRLKQKGIATLFVSHKLGEILEIAEKVSIIRDGVEVGDYSAETLDDRKLTFLMTGQKIVSEPYLPKEDGPSKTTLLELKGLTRKGHYQDINLSVKKGDILGVTGLIGSGRTELALSLFGLNRPDSGEIIMEGKPVSIRSSREAVRLGVGYLPEDRLLQGLAIEKSIGDNILVTIVDRLLTGLRLISGERKSRTESKWVKDLDIKTPSPAMPVSSLSGGNQQRVVLAKWLATDLKLFILDGPTIGIDIASKNNIHHIIRGFARKGLGVIMISDEIPEVLQHCNRVIVMRERRIVAEIENVQDVSEKHVFDLAAAKNAGQGM